MVALTSDHPQQVYILVKWLTICVIERFSMSAMAQTAASGILFALSAGILWGFMPVYINFLAMLIPWKLLRTGICGLL